MARETADANVAFLEMFQRRLRHAYTGSEKASQPRHRQRSSMHTKPKETALGLTGMSERAVLGKKPRTTNRQQQTSVAHSGATPAETSRDPFTVPIASLHPGNDAVPVDAFGFGITPLPSVSTVATTADDLQEMQQTAYDSWSSDSEDPFEFGYGPGFESYAPDALSTYVSGGPFMLDGNGSIIAVAA